MPKSINFLTISATGFPIFSLNSFTVISLEVRTAFVIVGATIVSTSFFFLISFLEPIVVSSKPSSSITRMLFCFAKPAFCLALTFFVSSMFLLCLFLFPKFLSGCAKTELLSVGAATKDLKLFALVETNDFTPFGLF